jgi:general secretion pathway protein L
MRETLHIRLRDPAVAPQPAALAYAITVNDSPVSVLVRSAPLDELLDLCAGRNIRLYAPSQDVRLLTATLPVKQASKALAAAPYALEEQFAEDVETLHFAVAAAPLPGHEWPVAVVNNGHMRDWLAPFIERGLVPEALVPETLALPWRDDGRWVALAEADHITVRTGPTAGFGCLPEDFELFLELAEAGTRQPLRIFITDAVQTDFTGLERDIELLPGLAHPLEALVRHYRPQQGINLLQGRYAMQRGLAREWQVWRQPAALLAGVFVVAAIGNGISAAVLNHRANQQVTTNEARFHALFPSEQRIVNLSAQAEQQFSAISGGNRGGGLLKLSDALADGLAAAPSLQVQGMQFRDDSLFASLTGSDLAALDRFKARFGGGHGTRLEVQSATSGEGGLQIRIKLSPA